MIEEIIKKIIKGCKHNIICEILEFEVEDKK
jgi:hypothetical protein